MAKKAFEMSFEIGGKMSSSFSNVFSRASNSLQDLKGQSRQAQRSLDQLGNDFRKGKIHQSQYAESTERITRELKQLEAAQRRVSSVKTTLGKGLNTVKMAAGIATVAVAATATAVAFKSINTAADFESKMSAVGAKTEATNDEMKALKQTAIELGAKSSLSASETAVAMDELAAKGFDVNKIIGAMPGIISAAEASGEDLALTSDTVATAINVFALEATEASRVADVLAMSANVSAAGVGDLAQVFKYAGKPANDLGISLEEVSAAAGIMTDAGLEGSNAGTALRSSLLSLNNPVKAQAKIMKKLGFSAQDSENNFKPLSTIVRELAESTKHMTKADRVATVAKLVGTEAVGGFLALMSAGPEKIDDMTEALKNSGGAAERAAAKMKDNYSGALEEMQGSVESAQIAFATPILPVFQDLFKGIGATIDGEMGVIEQAGERVAGGLRAILEPFSLQEPIKPVFEPIMDPDYVSEAMKAYQTDVDKYNLFSNMDFGDKVVYMLDEATERIEKWLSGSGGESMEKIFSKLGEIAAKAWLGAFTGAVKSAGSNLMQGNIATSLGMGAAAYMMGGGLMVKGAVGVGKWGVGMAKGAKASKAAKTAKAASSVPVTATATKPTPKSNKVVPFSKKETVKPSASSKVVPITAAKGAIATKPGALKSTFQKSSKVLGRAALPLTIASDAFSIYKSKDKTKSAAESGAGIAGGWGGAKIGAAIGTAILPGIGTAIGGALGGLLGYAGGKWVAGKAVDKARESNQPVTAVSSAAAVNPTTDKLKAAIDLGESNFKTLAMYAGEASGHMVGAFTAIKSSADLVKGNLDILTMYTGEASGWLASLNGIKTAGEGVITALKGLETRINNVQLPGVQSKRVSYDG